MRALSQDVRLLNAPDDEELDRAYATLRAIHGRAFDWDPPHVTGLERLHATRMRQHVRAWINEWDLRRLDPTFEPLTVAETLHPTYDEEPELDADADSG